MLKSSLPLFFLTLLTSFAEAQYSRHIIEFNDKKGTTSLGNPSLFLSQRAIERRTRYKIGLDSSDLPISPVYLDSIRSVPNVTILNVSKWLNQVCISTSDSAALVKIRNFSFVKRAAPIAARLLPSARPVQKALGKVSASTKQVNFANKTVATNLNYGSTFNQVHIHEGEYLHNQGYTGENIIIAILDAGFYGYQTNPVFDSLRMQNRILREWDFVANESSVNEDDAHGMFCLSVIAANRPGYMVGTAPKAKFFLFRTEDAPTEYPVEEQNWAAAAEQADSAGADMISSSLGYSEFDDHKFDHSYAERDGNTSIVTRAADLAAKKGMIVMNSAGNSGGLNNDFKFISCPADGDSVVAVGAVDINGDIASFSSWGPNGAGKVKPNVVSVGLGSTVAYFDGNPTTANGTSFSNPNLAGLVACLWQAYPEFSNMEIIDALQRSASRYNNPDDRFGYGIPNFRKASAILDEQRLTRNYNSLLNNDWIKAYPIPFKGSLNISFKAPATGKSYIRLLDGGGKLIEVKSMDVEQNNFYTLQFKSLPAQSKGTYLVQYFDGENRKVITIMKQGN